jgi:hypothetical protein
MGLAKNMVPNDRRFARSRSPATPPRRKMDSPVSGWKLGEAVEAENGLQFASLTTAEGGPIVLFLEGCVAPFEPSSWQEESSMKNLDLRLHAVTESTFACMTESMFACMQACVAETFRLPKYKTDAFKAFLHKREEYPANIRVKLQTTGLTKTRFWGTDKKQTGAPECYQGATFDAKIMIKGVWYAGDCWGLSLHATDLMLVKEAAIPDCPF